MRKDRFGLSVALFYQAEEAIADKSSADFANPGTAPQSFAANGATARFLRVTATKLAPRQNDFIFALAELSAFDPTGQNVALKATVTALREIAAGHVGLEMLKKVPT